MLFDNVDEHVPLPPIIKWAGKQPRDVSVIHRTVNQLDDSFEKVIRPLQLIPEKGVVLAELEVFDIHLFHCADPKQIQSSEHPASPGTFLVCDTPVVEHMAEREIAAGHNMPIEGYLVHRDFADRILCHLIGRMPLKITA